MVWLDYFPNPVIEIYFNEKLQFGDSNQSSYSSMTPFSSLKSSWRTKAPDQKMAIFDAYRYFAGYLLFCYWQTVVRQL